MTRAEITKAVQDFNGFPWHNGQMYVENKGWYSLAIQAHSVADDLGDVIEMLRDGGHYAESDRVRTLQGRLRGAASYAAPRK